MTWRQSTEKDLIKLELTWGEAEALAKKKEFMEEQGVRILWT